MFKTARSTKLLSVVLVSSLAVFSCGATGDYSSQIKKEKKSREDLETEFQNHKSTSGGFFKSILLMVTGTAFMYTVTRAFEGEGTNWKWLSGAGASALGFFATLTTGPVFWGTAAEDEDEEQYMVECLWCGEEYDSRTFIVTACPCLDTF